MGNKAYFFTGSGGKIKKGVILVLTLVVLLYLTKTVISMINIETADVARGVLFWDKDVGGWSGEEIKEYVQEVASHEVRYPVDAEVDFVNKCIIPEVSGLRIDVDATVRAITGANENETVLPVYRQIPAKVKWDDYPELPAYRGNPGENSVSFMINVAWGDEYLEDLLMALKKENVKATFFITGRWAEKNQDMVRIIADDGHELGNHGYSDAGVMTELQNQEIEDSLLSTNDLLYEATGTEVTYFTPHKGEYDNVVLEIVARNSMRTVMWSLDTVDWSDPGLEKMEDKIRDNVQSGDIILMHPTKDIPELLTRIIPFIKEQGLHILTVEEHLSPFPYF